jgi:hypothetical protein
LVWGTPSPSGYLARKVFFFNGLRIYAVRKIFIIKELRTKYLLSIN